VAKTPASNNERNLYGSWAPVPRLPDGGSDNVGQTKLWLWSKTPYDYTRHAGRTWDEWFVDRFNTYPCASGSPDVCWHFEHINPWVVPSQPWQHPELPTLRIEWDTMHNAAQVYFDRFPLRHWARSVAMVFALPPAQGLVDDFRLTFSLDASFDILLIYYFNVW